MVRRDDRRSLELADDTRYDAKQQAMQAKDAAVARAREASAEATLDEEDIGVLRIEIRMPGALFGDKTILPPKAVHDPPGDGTDQLTFDPDATDRDNRRGNSDAD